MNLEAYDESELNQILREAVRDALEEELLKLRVLLALYRSDEELDETEDVPLILGS